jgi:hypothetical protein
MVLGPVVERGGAAERIPMAHGVSVSHRYRIPDESGRGTVTSAFRPVGLSIGIFKYQELYYFDTFFDPWGDFQNRRGESADISNTLAVFLRQTGKTQQVCEYLMTETDKTTERDKP